MNIARFVQKSESARIISVVYSIFGVAYIYITYFYVRASIIDSDELQLLYNQTIIRAVFILLSATLLYFLVRFFHRKMESSFNQYEQLFKQNPNAMWVFDTNTLRFLAVNTAAIEKYGFTEAEFLSMTIKDIRPEQDQPLLQTKYSAKPGFNLSGIWKHKLKTGELIDVEISTHTMEYEGYQAKLVLAYDVTNRIRYERQIVEFNHTLERRVNDRTRELHESLQEQAALTEELETYNEELMSTNEQLVEARELIQRQSQKIVEKSEARLKQVLNAVKDFVWSARFKDGQFDVEFMSPAVEDILGFTAEDYFENTSIWFNAIAEEDREATRLLLANIGRKEYEEIEYCVRHPKTWKIKYVLSRIWVRPIADDSYQLNGIISDISERKKQEQEKSILIKQLINQNNDLLQFSYIASHNLRGPVATLLGLIQLMEKEEKPSDIRAISTHLLYSTRKLDDVIVDLTKILEIRADHSLPKDWARFPDIFENVKESLLSQIDKNKAELMTDFSAVDSIYTIKSYLHSIIYNLIANAIKYRSPDRDPVISITSFKEEKRIGFVIRDNGLGIDLEKHREKLFSLYQRFHNHVDGKGMGLYLVRSQTLALGGTIEIQSVLGEGTCLTLTFPVNEELVTANS